MIPVNNQVSHETLLSLLDYCPGTGIFKWKVDLKGRGGHVKIGKIAGSLHHSGYLTISIDGVAYQAHRLAWYYVHKVWPGDEVDHINRERADNRILNLRSVSKAQNQHNIVKPRHNTSGHLNVHFNNSAQKWKVHLKYLGKSYFGGYFRCKQAACEAAANLRKALHNDPSKV